MNDYLNEWGGLALMAMGGAKYQSEMLAGGIESTLAKLANPEQPTITESLTAMVERAEQNADRQVISGHGHDIREDQNEELYCANYPHKGRRIRQCDCCGGWFCIDCRDSESYYLCSRKCESLPTNQDWAGGK